MMLKTVAIAAIFPAVVIIAALVVVIVARLQFENYKYFYTVSNVHSNSKGGARKWKGKLLLISAVWRERHVGPIWSLASIVLIPSCVSPTQIII